MRVDGSIWRIGGSGRMMGEIVAMFFYGLLACGLNGEEICF